MKNALSVFMHFFIKSFISVRISAFIYLRTQAIYHRGSTYAIRQVPSATAKPSPGTGKWYVQVEHEHYTTGGPI